MNLIDLFAGIGGFSLAAHGIGWQTLAFVEKDEFCRKVLAKNFKGAAIYDDIFDFSGKPFRGQCDIITAGFPCQPFSTAGARNGVNDERYLFPETLRVIAEAKPTWVVLENVDGLVSMANDSRLLKVERQRSFRTPDEDRYEALYTFQEDMLLEVICQEIENQGYEVQPVVIPVSALGAVHERYRVFIIAHTQNAQPGTLEKSEDGKKRNGVGRSSPTSSNGDRVRQSQPQRRISSFGRRIGDGDRQISSDTDVCRCKEPLQSGQIGAEFAGTGVGDDSIVPTFRQSLGLKKQGIKKSAGIGQADRFDAHPEWRESWQSVALRTCVLSVDDGFSRRLVRPVGWRRNAIKAAGNSVSPVLALEILRCIQGVN